MDVRYQSLDMKVSSTLWLQVGVVCMVRQMHSNCISLEIGSSRSATAALSKQVSAAESKGKSLTVAVLLCSGVTVEAADCAAKVPSNTFRPASLTLLSVSTSR